MVELCIKYRRQVQNVKIEPFGHIRIIFDQKRNIGPRIELLIAVHIAESDKSGRKTVIGQDLSHAIGKVLEHNVLLVPVAFPARCYQFYFVLPGEQRSLDLSLLKI